MLHQRQSHNILYNRTYLTTQIPIENPEKVTKYILFPNTLPNILTV